MRKISFYFSGSAKDTPRYDTPDSSWIEIVRISFCSRSRVDSKNWCDSQVLLQDSAIILLGALGVAQDANLVADKVIRELSSSYSMKPKRVLSDHYCPVKKPHNLVTH